MRARGIGRFGVIVAVIVLAAAVGCSSGDGRSSDAPPTTATPVRFLDPVFADVETQRDIPYRPDGAPYVLDLVEPAGDTSARRPVLLLIHGGGYYSGDKADLADDVEFYARVGYVVANVNYRLYPDLEELQARTAGGPLDPADELRLTAAFDSAVGDTRAAVEYLRSRADELRIDPRRIATVGWSAGGSTSLGHLLTRSFDPDPGPETPDVAAAVIASGSIGAALIDDIGPNPPPVLFLGFETDTANSANPPDAVCARIREQRGTCKFDLDPTSGHFVDLEAEAGRILPFLESVGVGR